MALPVSDQGFTGPLLIDVALRFDTLGDGASQPLVALGAEGEAPRLVFGQVGATEDLRFALTQAGVTYEVIAPDALVVGEVAVFSAGIDDAGVMSIAKDGVELASGPGVVPLALPVEDLTGPGTAFDPEVIDLEITALSPALAGGDMAIVAHQDDDLLFMNPTIADTIAAGDPMTTVYVTAGDAGGDRFYWGAREAGVKAAYAQMAGVDDWVDEIVTLDVGGTAREVASSYLESAPGVRLYFLRTPDGDDGDGTVTYGNQSLELLLEGAIDRVSTVDGQTSYTVGELTDVIAAVMARHVPDDILIQEESAPGEHTDHVHVGELVEDALPIYGGDLTVTRFQSYDSAQAAVNLSPDEAALVTSVFETYAAFDEVVIDDAGALRPPYTEWVLREYVTEQFRVVDGARVDAPGSGGPDPVDPVEPEEPVDPVEPEDPGPVDPPPPDPVPPDPDPTPEDPDPTPVSDWTTDLYGAGGAIGQLLGGLGTVPVVPTGSDPVAPDPVEPVDPTPDAFGSDGLYQQLLSGASGNWADIPSEPPTEPAPEPAPAPTGGAFDPGGLYEQLMISGTDKWAALDTPEEEEEEVSDAPEAL